MEIRLTQPDPFLDRNLALAAQAAGCWARVKWWTPYKARFTVTADCMGRELMASTEQHERVIASLLERHPEAEIRTARATYEGRADFEAQRKARVA